MFKCALMTMALLSSYPSQAMDCTELDRYMERDIATSKKMHSPSPGKGIAVQAEEKKNEKSKE